MRRASCSVVAVVLLALAAAPWPISAQQTATPAVPTPAAEASTATPVPPPGSTSRPPAAPTGPGAPSATGAQVGDATQAMLSETDVADLPARLRYEPRLSGPFNFLVVQGEMVSFVAEEAMADLQAVPALPAGTVFTVSNAVYLFPESPVTGDMLDRIAQGQRAGGQMGAQLSGGAGAISVEDFPDQPVGEESRAFAIHAEYAGDAMSSAIVLFSRGTSVVTMIVGAVGQEAPLAEAVRLAQFVDSRLVAAR